VDSVFDASLSQASCEVRADSLHLSVTQSLDALAKSLLYVSEFVSTAQSSLQSSLVTAMEASLVSPLRLEVATSLEKVQEEVNKLQAHLLSEHAALSASLLASQASTDATISGLIGEVAAATTVTLRTISQDSHNNLTRLEKAVFNSYNELKESYGVLLEGSVLQLEGNVTRLTEELEAMVRMMQDETLPLLRADITEQTEQKLETRLDM
jgi:hypothetical protein